jgi:ADP-heptose:LPS heptosyltransferase
MLIAVPTRWDEACFAVPAVRAVVASGVGVGVLCPAAQRDFWATLRELAIVELPAKASAKVAAAALAGNWQAALVWEAGVAADACARAKIPRRVGPADKALKRLLTHPVALPAPGRPLEHRVRHYLALVESLGVATGRVEFFAPAELRVRPEAGTVLLCPDSDFGRTHEWPVTRWEEVARELLAAGHRITIANLPDGARLGHALLSRLGGEIPYFDVPDFAAVLPLLAVHAVVLAADGTLPHLAAHVGATCVTLFGPNDPAWKRPLGKRHVSVRRHVECAPCFLPKCPLDSRCQHELDARRVTQAVLEKLGGETV